MESCSMGRQSKGSWRLNEDEGPDLVLCMDWETRAQREAVPGMGTHSKSVVALGSDTRVSPSASCGNSCSRASLLECTQQVLFSTLHPKVVSPSATPRPAGLRNSSRQITETRCSQRYRFPSYIAHTCHSYKSHPVRKTILRHHSGQTQSCSFAPLPPGFSTGTSVPP